MGGTSQWRIGVAGSPLPWVGVRRVVTSSADNLMSQVGVVGRGCIPGGIGAGTARQPCKAGLHKTN